MGLILWYQVEFPDQKIKVSSDVYSGDYLVDAEIEVSYAIGSPGSFQVRFKDLPLRVHEAIASALGSEKGRTSGVKVVIKLGYLEDSADEAVLIGRVESIESTTRFPPLGSLMSGHEEAAYALLNTINLYNAKPPPKTAHLYEPPDDGGDPLSPADVAKKIVEKVKSSDEAAAIQPAIAIELVAPASAPAPTDPISDVKRKSYNYDDAESAFHLLDRVASDFGAEVLIQDGKVLFGSALKYPPEGGFPSIPDVGAVLALLTGEDTLIAVKEMSGARLAEFKPVQIGTASKRRVITDRPPAADVRAFDFTALGAPGMRAGQMVIASVEGFDNVFDAFRILELTHSFSPDTGYVCTGRAVTFIKQADVKLGPDRKNWNTNRQLSDQARKGSPLSIADRLTSKIKDTQAGLPAVDVGRVKAAKPEDRVASLYYGQAQNNTVSSPSVDVDIAKELPLLLSKPIASPFAWHKVGLSVPVYEGMRALLNQVRSVRDDAVVTGFLWANETRMERPKAHAGDWWLCLPTELTTSDPKLPTGKGANDLISADGRRVVEVAGLKITVGKSQSTDVGDRPQEGKADEVLITAKNGTSIQIDDQGNVTVEGKGKTVTLKCGGATLTVGNSQVAIS